MKEPMTLTPVVGPFSGVDYEHLLETPILDADNVPRVPREPIVTELAGRHPRLFFTADDIDAMRARLQNETVQQYYELAGALDRDPPPFKPGERNGGPFRQLPAYALSYVLAPAQEKLEGIIAWLEMAVTYPHVGADLDVMARDSKVQREERPFLFCDLKSRKGLDDVVAWLERECFFPFTAK